MDLLAQSSVTVQAPVVVHRIFLWQFVAVGGAALVALLFLVGFLFVALAGFQRDRPNKED
jgi:hypothetical protein